MLIFSFVDVLILMFLGPGETFNWYGQITHTVLVDVDIYELERRVGKGCLTQSRLTGLITIRD